MLFNRHNHQIKFKCIHDRRDDHIKIDVIIRKLYINTPINRNMAIKGRGRNRETTSTKKRSIRPDKHVEHNRTGHLLDCPYMNRKSWTGWNSVSKDERWNRKMNTEIIKDVVHWTRLIQQPGRVLLNTLLLQLGNINNQLRPLIKGNNKRLKQLSL